MIQEFVQAVMDTVHSCMKGMHTAMPGEIVAFNPTTGLATVLPKVKFKKPDGSTMDFPQITGVPVLFPQAMNQQAVIAFPVKAGDGCLIIIAEQSLDYWMYGQETATDLAFDMTNAICIPGLYARGSTAVMEACETNSVIIDVKGTRLSVRNGMVDITAPEVRVNGNLSVSGKISAGTDVAAGNVSLKDHRHTAPMCGETTIPH